jgi:hypothetical protein
MNTTLETILDIESLPVKIDYVGQTQKEQNWDCDQWRVTLSSKAGFHSFDYFTGIGLRIRRYYGYGSKWDAMQKKHYDDKPQKPKVADVLYSLIMDASAADENFHEWCDNYGYSDDSIKAMNIYKSCLEIAVALRKHFSPDILRQVRELLQDY